MRLPKTVLLLAIVGVTAVEGGNPGGSACVIDGNISEDTPQGNTKRCQEPFIDGWGVI